MTNKTTDDKSKKAHHGNPMIEELMKRQNLIESGKEAEKEITGKNQEMQPEGEKRIVDQVSEDFKNDLSQSLESRVGEYEDFFKLTDKFAADVDVSVYIYSRLHKKLKSIVTAEADKKTNMTILLSNIVEDFFTRYDKNIKRSLKKLTEF